MPEVKFKGGKKKHIFLNGKFIDFENGKAQVTNEDVGAIKKLNNPDYTVVEEKKKDKPDKKEDKPNKKTEKKDNKKS